MPPWVLRRIYSFVYKGRIFRTLASWNHANLRIAVCRDDSLTQGFSSPLCNNFEFSAIAEFSREDRVSRSAQDWTAQRAATGPLLAS